VGGGCGGVDYSGGCGSWVEGMLSCWEEGGGGRGAWGAVGGCREEGRVCVGGGGSLGRGGGVSVGGGGGGGGNRAGARIAGLGVLRSCEVGGGGTGGS